MADPQAEITVGSGDILLGNWVTILGRVASLAGQRWGHAALVVDIEGEPHVYEISVASQKPVVVPLADYLRDPTLKELAVRQLRQPLGLFAEEQLKEAVLAHDHARYPPLAQVFGRFSGKGAPTVGHGGVYLCSELVYAVLRVMGWVTDGQEQREAPRPGQPLLPDQLAPGGLTQLDARYEPEMKVVARRTIPREQALALLERQALALPRLLLP